MKRHVAILILAAALLAGCQHPTEVRLNPSDQLEVASLASVDTTGSSPVDTLGLLEADEDEYAGLLLVNDVKSDAGGGVVEFAFTRVYFADRDSPFISPTTGRVLGYYGVDLGRTVSLSSASRDTSLARVPFQITVLGLKINLGWQYMLDMTGWYQPATRYTWASGAATVGQVSVAVQSPADLVVLSPAGGTRIPRTEDLTLRWSGSGNLVIVVSTYNVLTKRTRPVMKIRPYFNTGHATISSRILAALPHDRFFVFTFILANRNDSSRVAGFGGAILAQAASVYNIYVELL